jgi:hypothetical protein
MSFVSTKLMGGLGNYLFQISTAYYLCLRDNKEFVFRSLSVFASDNNISSSTLSKLLKGEIEYRGWKLTRKDLKT